MNKDTLHYREPNTFSAQERLNNANKNSSENDQPATPISRNESGSFIIESTISSSIVLKKPHTPWFDWG
ncbi:hypothetical protein PJIAN_3276 [Paludibacter jiangxiensis]|uniref:Uncharacterized protein n=1 Tax=Paludibacter jiangxiensis TaxID=681398 RepID=A0A161L7X1_9BACT|nr:hypothetical protein PJIAN_3276 [Paludibacter jiangxiensis]